MVLHEAEHEAKTAPVTLTNTPNGPSQTAVKAVNAVPGDVTDLLLDQMQQLTTRMENLSNLSIEVDRLNQELIKQQQQHQQQPLRPPVWNRALNTVGLGSGQAGFGNRMGGGGSRAQGYPRGTATQNNIRGPSRGNPNVGGGPRFPAPGSQCRKCGQSSGGGWWDHCFECCGVGHQAIDCPTKNLMG